MVEENRSNCPYSNEVVNLDRREFIFKKLPLFLAYLLAGHQINRVALDPLNIVLDQNSVKFTPARLGLTINFRNFGWYDLDRNEALQQLLALPVEHVRIPIPFDIVERQKGQFDFSTTDEVVQKAKEHKKTIHFQFGAKTAAGKEVNLPEWLLDEMPELNKPGPLDIHPKFREYTMEYLEQSASRYLPKVEGRGAIYVENEGHNRRLPLTNYRYITQPFHREEVALVKTIDPFRRPIIQNIPDTIGETFTLLKRDDIDIVGFNIYDQAEFFNLPIPKSIYKEGYWAGVKFLARLVEFFGKQRDIPERQSNYWLNGAKEPVYPFSIEKFLEGMLRLQNIMPEAIVFLWDVEQRLWRAKYHGGVDQIEELEALTF